MYNVPFSGDERQNIKFMIQSRLYSYLGILLEGREWFEEESLLVENRKGDLRDERAPSGTIKLIPPSFFTPMSDRSVIFHVNQ